MNQRTRVLLSSLLVPAVFSACVDDDSGSAAAGGSNGLGGRSSSGGNTGDTNPGGRAGAPSTWGGSAGTTGSAGQLGSGGVSARAGGAATGTAGATEAGTANGGASVVDGGTSGSTTGGAEAGGGGYAKGGADRPGGGGAGGPTGNTPRPACNPSGGFSQLLWSSAVRLGPHNHAFLEPVVQTTTVTNYANQPVFEAPSIRLVAAYAIAPQPQSTAASGGVALQPWLGELAIVPKACDPETLQGKTLRATLLWRLNGAITQEPRTGVSFGGYDAGAPTAFADATILYPGVDAEGNPTARSLNSLAPIRLSHTFSSAGEASAAARGGVYLRVYLLSAETEIPTTVYIGELAWE